MEPITNYNLSDKLDNPYNFDALFELFCASSCEGGKKDAPGAFRACTNARGASDPSISSTGAPSANRRSLKYQRKTSGVQKSFFRGGFDGGVELAFYGEYEPSVKNWFKSFEDLRERIRMGDELAAYADLFGVPVRLFPAGAKVGHLTYSYQFEFHGIRFLFHNSPCPDVPAVRVVIGAVPLLRCPVQDVYAFILKLLNFAGVNIYREIVSRADLMVMVNNYTVSDFLNAMNGGRFTTRCRGKMAIYSDLSSGNIESLTLKSSRVELCIYDKLAELSTKDETYYKWFCSRFDWNLPDKLTRIEFRFRREALRYYGINKFSDLLNTAGALVKKFSSDWFRILSRPKVRGSEREISTAACWRQVQLLFQSVFSADCSLPLVRSVRPAVVKVDKLVKMAVGCVAKSCAILQKSVNPIKDVSDAVFDLLYPFFKLIEEKRVSAALVLSADGYYDSGDL